MSGPVYCIYDYRRGNYFIPCNPGVYLFCHTSHICCLVDLVFDTKIHCLIHYFYIKYPCEFFNMLKLIPYVTGLIMAYLKEIFFNLIRIGEQAG